jgi:hypothetical protein
VNCYSLVPAYVYCTPYTITHANYSTLWLMQYNVYLFPPLLCVRRHLVPAKTTLTGDKSHRLMHDLYLLWAIKTEVDCLLRYNFDYFPHASSFVWYDTTNNTNTRVTQTCHILLSYYFTKYLHYSNCELGQLLSELVLVLIYFQKSQSKLFFSC